MRKKEKEPHPHPRPHCHAVTGTRRRAGRRRGTGNTTTDRAASTNMRGERRGGRGRKKWGMGMERRGRREEKRWGLASTRKKRRRRRRKRRREGGGSWRCSWRKPTWGMRRRRWHPWDEERKGGGRLGIRGMVLPPIKFNTSI